MFMTVIEERADAQQRQAIEAVSHGKETEPGKLVWQGFSTTISKLLPIQYKPIDLVIDYWTESRALMCQACWRARPNRYATQ